MVGWLEQGSLCLRWRHAETPKSDPDPDIVIALPLARRAANPANRVRTGKIYFIFVSRPRSALCFRGLISALPVAAAAGGKSSRKSISVFSGRLSCVMNNTVSPRFNVTRNGVAGSTPCRTEDSRRLPQAREIDQDVLVRMCTRAHPTLGL